MTRRGWPRRSMAHALRIATLSTLVAIAAVLILGAPSATGSGQGRAMPGKAAWHALGTRPPAGHPSLKPDLKLRRARVFSLDRSGFAQVLRNAPSFTKKLSAQKSTLVSLPDPSGGYQRFSIHRSNLMAPGLAAKHPDITTYSGIGVDDPSATIHADFSHLGFHASVRSSSGAWYIDPYFHLDQSVYASYYGRDVTESPTPFIERDANGAELSVDKGYYHASDAVKVSGSGFAANGDVTITISDPEGKFASRTETARSDGDGSFTATFDADPDGNLDTHAVEAAVGKDWAAGSYQVVRSDDPTTDPPTGDVLRTYRLALITDPGYAAYVGGPSNVTAAKVALMNRVDQVYEDDLSIHMQLIGNNDLLNLNTWDQAVAPNGPCGAAACFTQAQVTGCSSTTRARFVIGQIIGASNYDVGHLALGQPGGGVANLGVVGRSNKAGGCTGIPTPVGDFYAIDYVAHEMGHQFSGNHPFNGTQLNCSGGNRNASTSTEPGSGSSVMAYAGICLTDDLQRHSDPYFSERSQQEISTYTSSDQAPINEVQTASLRHFGGGNEQQVATFGPGFAPTATIQPLSVAIGAVPSATQLGGAQEIGNTVTISTGAAGSTHTLQPGDTVTIAGVANTGYNGTFTVTSVPSTRSFTYTNPTGGLPLSGGGTITLLAPGATETGTTVTIRTAAAHGRSVGDVVSISGVGVSAYNGVFTITSVPTPRSFTYTSGSSGLANSGGGTTTFDSPFMLQFNGNNSALINNANYSNAGLAAAINGIAGFPGTVTVSGTSSTGFTVDFGGASAGTDLSSLSIQNLACAPGCFSRVDETNHGGAFDAFTLNYDGNVSAPITNGTNYSAAAIQTALQGVSEVQTVSLTGFGVGDSYTLNYNGVDSVPITGGQNDTAAGVQAALQGGNEQQQVTLASFNATNAGNSFHVVIGGNSSAELGNGGLAISNANVAAAVNAISGFAGTVTAAGAGNTGFTLTFGGASANTDVPAISIVLDGCSPGCSSTVRENVKGTTGVSTWPTGGTVAAGSFSATGYTLTFSGTLQGTDVSQVTVTNPNGLTATTAETTKGAPGILPPGSTATVAGFGGGGFTNTGFQVTYGANLGLVNVPVTLALQDFTAGASGFVGETDKGGAVDNKGGPGLITPTGDAVPVVSAPTQFTIPLRTPFALTGSATDADGDSLIYSWEQNDRGAAAGTTLLSNTKTNGPLFAMFPFSGQISDEDSLLYGSPGENHLTSSPTRVFPDLQQIIDNNTNADTGSCPEVVPIAPPVPQATTECFAEFLPTSDYVGFTGVNASPLSLHMRLTARDDKGGTSSADTTLLLASGAGPFLVSAPNAPTTWPAGSTKTVSWDVANTDVDPIDATDVKISLSLDGGHTYPIVLASSTPNDGSQAVTVPNVATTEARIKVEAVGNVFFDISNADFTITLPGLIGLDSLSWTGDKALVDSYDSSAGPYGPANNGNAAEVFSNGKIDLDAMIHGSVRSALGNVDIKPHGLVTGDVQAGGKITNKGTILGTATPNSPTPTIDPPSVPACSPYSDGSGLSGSGFKYNAAKGDLNVDKSVTLAGGTYCFHKLTLAGKATLNVTGPVTIVLNEKLDVGPDAVLNATGNPANLQLVSSFTKKGGVHIGGHGVGYLSVYAPDTDVTLDGDASLYGAVIGATLSGSGKAAAHYDKQLVTVFAKYFNP